MSFTQSELDTISRIQKLVTERTKALKKVANKQASWRKHKSSMEKIAGALTTEQELLSNIENSLSKLKIELMDELSGSLTPIEVMDIKPTLFQLGRTE